MKNNSCFSFGRTVATGSFLVFTWLFGWHWGFLCSVLFVVLSAVRKGLSRVRKGLRFDWIDFVILLGGGCEFWISVLLIFWMSGLL